MKRSGSVIMRHGGPVAYDDLLHMALESHLCKGRYTADR